MDDAEQDSPPSEDGDLRLEEKYTPLIVFFRHHLPASFQGKAEDLTQDTLMALWRAGQGDKRVVVRDLESYMFAIARNKLKSALRSHYKQGPWLSLDDVPQDVLDRIVRASKIDAAEQLELHQVLARSMTCLQPEERIVLELRFLEGLSNEAAASIIAVDPKECSRLKYRALKKLREAVAREMRPRVGRQKKA
ncbi:MAG: RNA polymerase sigma factor [Candidatus Polarisedimenticolia bacterium]